MPHFHLHRPSDDLIPWSQAGYVIMVGLAVMVIAARSDMNPTLRQFLRAVPVIGEFVRSGDAPTLRPSIGPGAPVSPVGQAPGTARAVARASVLPASDPESHRSV